MLVSAVVAGHPVRHHWRVSVFQTKAFFLLLSITKQIQTRAKKERDRITCRTH